MLHKNVNLYRPSIGLQNSAVFEVKFLETKVENIENEELKFSNKICKKACSVNIFETPNTAPYTNEAKRQSNGHLEFAIKDSLQRTKHF